MSASSYLLTLIISFLGLFAGFFLAHAAKEELKDISHYMKLLKFAFILLIAASLFLFMDVFIWFNILLLIMLGITAYFVDVQSFIIYPPLGIVFYIVSSSQTMLFITSFLIFLLGISVGTLMAEKNIKDKKSLIFRLFYENVSYVAVALIMPLFF